MTLIRPSRASGPSGWRLFHFARMVPALANGCQQATPLFSTLRPCRNKTVGVRDSQTHQPVLDLDLGPEVGSRVEGEGGWYGEVGR